MKSFSFIYATYRSIVPKDYDLDENHIDAKPFSLCVSSLDSLNDQLLLAPKVII